MTFYLATTRIIIICIIILKNSNLRQFSILVCVVPPIFKIIEQDNMRLTVLPF